jgi:hypothetical protein
VFVPRVTPVERIDPVNLTCKVSWEMVRAMERVL